MWYVEIFSVSIHEGTTQATESLDRVLHPNVEDFMLEGQLPTPMMKAIYFLTNHSRTGEPINLRTFPLGFHNIEDYSGMYCEANTKKVESKVPIHKITSLNIQIVLYMIGWIKGSTPIHQD
jgi:hypothetical protein